MHNGNDREEKIRLLRTKWKIYLHKYRASPGLQAYSKSLQGRDPWDAAGNMEEGAIAALQAASQEAPPTPTVAPPQLPTDPIPSPGPAAIPVPQPGRMPQPVVAPVGIRPTPKSPSPGLFAKWLDTLKEAIPLAARTAWKSQSPISPLEPAWEAAKSSTPVLEAIAQGGVIPAVSEAVRPILDMAPWETPPGEKALETQLGWPPIKIKGEPTLSFDQFLNVGGGVNLGAVADFLQAATPTSPAGSGGILARAARGVVAEHMPGPPVIDLPFGGSLTVAGPRLGTLAHRSVQEEAEKTGVPPTGREWRQARERRYPYAPFVRGTLEELPYLALPQAGTVRGAIRGTSLAAKAARGALLPLEATEKATTRAAGLAARGLMAPARPIARGLGLDRTPRRIWEEAAGVPPSTFLGRMESPFLKGRAELEARIAKIDARQSPGQSPAEIRRQIAARFEREDLAREIGKQDALLLGGRAQPTVAPTAQTPLTLGQLKKHPLLSKEDVIGEVSGATPARAARIGGDVVVEGADGAPIAGKVTGAGAAPREPILAKHPIDMTPEEFDDALRRLKDYEDNIEVAILGPERAKEYKNAYKLIERDDSRLMRTGRGLGKETEVDEARRTVSRIENSLSKSESDAMFGVRDENTSWPQSYEELAGFSDAVRIGNPDDTTDFLMGVVGRELYRVKDPLRTFAAIRGNKKIVPPSGKRDIYGGRSAQFVSLDQQEAAIKTQNAIQELQRRGASADDIFAESYRRLSSEIGEEDAQYLLRDWFDLAERGGFRALPAPARPGVAPAAPTGPLGSGEQHRMLALGPGQPPRTRGRPGTPPVGRPIPLGEGRRIVTRTITEQETDDTLNWFVEFISNPEAVDAWAITKELRAAVRAERALELDEIYRGLINQGVPIKEAYRQSLKALEGPLPAVHRGLPSMATERVEDALYSRVDEVFSKEGGADSFLDRVSTFKALRNALDGNPIPRDPGVKEGSAFSRLEKVFSPEIVKILDSKKPLGDTIEVAVGRQPRNQLRLWEDFIPPEGALVGQEPHVFKPVEKWLGDAAHEAEVTAALRQIDVDADFSRRMARSLGKYPERGTLPTKVTSVEDQAVEVAIEQASNLPKDTVSQLQRAAYQAGLTTLDFGNFLRANMASFDISYPRQVALLMANNPVKFARSFRHAFRALHTKGYAEKRYDIITNPGRYATKEDRDAWDLYVKVGADFLRPVGGKVERLYQASEDYMLLVMTKEQEKLRPLQKLGDFLPWIRMSGRAHVTGLNEMTWSIWKQELRSMADVQDLINVGVIPEPSMVQRAAARASWGQVSVEGIGGVFSEKLAKRALAREAGTLSGFSAEREMTEIAKMLEIYSGRGPLRAGLQEIAPALNALTFSARLASARMLTWKPWVSSSRYTRKLAWRNFIASVGSIISVLMLGDAAGWWEVELDPRSADFMKARIGNRTLDIWGGMQQYMVLFARLLPVIGGIKSMQTRQVESVKTDPLDLLWSFSRSKASPIVHNIVEAFVARDYRGSAIDRADWQRWLTRNAPLAPMAIIEAFEEEGLTGLAVAATELLGGSVGSSGTPRWAELDEFYELPPGRLRRDWRGRNRLGEAKLFIRGSITTVRDRAVQSLVLQLMAKHRIPWQDIRGFNEQGGPSFGALRTGSYQDPAPWFKRYAQEAKELEAKELEAKELEEAPTATPVPR